MATWFITFKFLTLWMALCLPVFAQPFSPKAIEEAKKIAQPPGRVASLGENIFAGAVKVTQRIGVYDMLRGVVVNAIAVRDIENFELERGRTIPIQRYVNSGLAGDVYFVEVNGERQILKVPKHSVTARRSMRQANDVHRWLAANTNIELPKIMDKGKRGRWVMLEFIDGQSLDQYIAAHGGWDNVPPKVKDGLEDFHRIAKELHAQTGLTLDISADNIFIRDGKPVLVDFGPIPSEHGFASEFKDALARWIHAAQSQPPGITVKPSALERVPASLPNSCFGQILKQALP